MCSQGPTTQPESLCPGARPTEATGEGRGQGPTEAVAGQRPLSHLLSRAAELQRQLQPWSSQPWRGRGCLTAAGGALASAGQFLGRRCPPTRRVPEALRREQPQSSPLVSTSPSHPSAESPASIRASSSAWEAPGSQGRHPSAQSKEGPSPPTERAPCGAGLTPGPAMAAVGAGVPDEAGGEFQGAIGGEVAWAPRGAGGGHSPVLRRRTQGLPLQTRRLRPRCRAAVWLRRR